MITEEDFFNIKEGELLYVKDASNHQLVSKVLLVIEEEEYYNSYNQKVKSIIFLTENFEKLWMQSDTTSQLRNISRLEK